MTKITLFGITVICVTVLCFTIIVGERLCSLNISNGNTVVQAILMCNKWLGWGEVFSLPIFSSSCQSFGTSTLLSEINAIQIVGVMGGFFLGGAGMMILSDTLEKQL
ncbi:Hok/Gef family protein [Proteus vulgaris]|uniref:Hok/Gef family protein n=1 Tax=Proteus columbae TaxID=1987580 RepID=UPI0018E496E8|nr:Hok/Gef family protein [Proteus vulgaris]